MADSIHKGEVLAAVLKVWSSPFTAITAISNRLMSKLTQPPCDSLLRLATRNQQCDSSYAHYVPKVHAADRLRERRLTRTSASFSAFKVPAQFFRSNARTGSDEAWAETTACASERPRFFPFLRQCAIRGGWKFLLQRREPHWRHRRSNLPKNCPGVRAR